MVNYSAGNAFALNSFSLVNFKNDPINCNPQDDMNGVRVSICELLVEQNRTVYFDNFDNDPTTPNTPTFVVGSPNGLYWARYGNNDIVKTSLVLIFPAQGGNNDLDMTIFDDNEMTQSAYYEAPEVAHIVLDTDIAAFDSGEILISVRNANFIMPAPIGANSFPPAFFGFSLVEGPNFVDIYPIVRSSFAYCDDTTGNCGWFF